MRFIETIKNIYKIEELRKRLVYTFLLILVYRFGCFVVLPGIDASMIAGLQSTAQEGLVGLLNMFSGGAFGNASIFALGRIPRYGPQPDSRIGIRRCELARLEQFRLQPRGHRHPYGRLDVRDVAR